MAKKKRKSPQAPQAAPERSVPRFEIGKKGDEFDQKYTEVIKKEQNRVQSLFSGLFSSARRSEADLISFAVLSLVIVMMSLSFAFLSRGGKAPTLRLEKLPSGEYLRELQSYYKEELPLGDRLRSAGNALGLCETRAETEDTEETEPLPAVTEPAVTEPPVTTTERPITTAPPTTEAPTTVPAVETGTQTEPEETTRMYAAKTAYIRLTPDQDSMIIGYFYTNERVEVIESFEDGWSSIWYNGAVLYVETESLSERRARVTAEMTTEETEPEPDEPEETTAPEEEQQPRATEPDVTDISETTEATTTAQRFMDPQMSLYMSRLERDRQRASQTEPPESSAEE